MAQAHAYVNQTILVLEVALGATSSRPQEFDVYM